MDAVLLVPFLVGAAVLAGGTALWRERRRHAALRAFAVRQGWQLVRRDDVWARELEGEPFGRGTGRRCEDVLLGTHGGRDVVAFDYSFRTHSTDANGQRQTRTHRYAVALLRLPVAVARVEVEPASWLSGLFDRGLELESQAFNDRYRVRADDPRLAYDLLPARSMQLLLDRPELSLRLLGGTAVAWDRGRLDPPELLERLDTVTALLDAVPSWVWEDRR